MESIHFFEVYFVFRGAASLHFFSHSQDRRQGEVKVCVCRCMYLCVHTHAVPPSHPPRDKDALGCPVEQSGERGRGGIRTPKGVPTSTVNKANMSLRKAFASDCFIPGQTLKFSFKKDFISQRDLALN